MFENVHSSAKKVIFVNKFRHTNFDAEKYKQRMWSVLQTATTLVYFSREPSVNYQELYLMVENLCTLGYADFIYKNLQRVLLDILETTRSFLEAIEYDFLMYLHLRWCAFKNSIRLLHNIFLFMKRYHDGTIYSVSMNMFKSIVITSKTIQDKMMIDLLRVIRYERMRWKTEEIVKLTVQMIQELHVYEEVFKPRFLKATKEFYKGRVQSYIDQGYSTSYMGFVEDQIRHEQQRTEDYLDVKTGNEVMAIMHHELIEVHLDEILEKFLPVMLERERKLLPLLYKLLLLVPKSLASLEERFSAYLLHKGSLIVKGEKYSCLYDTNDVIRDLLIFKSDMDRVVFEAFANSDKLQMILKQSFIQFVNNSESKPAELLARFLDERLRDKKMEEEALERMIPEVMALFRFIHGKDVFAAFYKKGLARRLLFGKSTNQDVENSILSKLKEECGGNYTAKLEGMFRDITISTEMNDSFHHYLRNLELDHADFNVSVLTSSYWPSYKTYEANLPPELVKYQQLFQKFYSAKHSGRKLIWQPYLGQCIVKVTFENGTKELQVSIFQAVVLLLYNDSNAFRYSEIQELTGLNPEALKRTMISLTQMRNPLLLKSPPKKEMRDDDFYTFNEDYQNPLYRVRINQVQLQETEDEHKATREGILHDRQLQIDAAIVRTLKREKILEHNVLVSQLYDVLGIPVDPVDIKRRIELLIERDYIERDQNNPACYKYVA